MTAFTTRVLLVDDHPLVRMGLRQLIDRETDLGVCAEAAGAAEALAAARAHDPDVVVVDLMLADGNGLDLVKALHEELPHVAVLVLSMHDQRVYGERCLKAGAQGYLMKEEAAARVAEALRTVAAGRTFGQQASAGAPSPVATLSDRELAVFELVGAGLPTRAIAMRLSLSDKTVETHKANIKRKLGIGHAGELVRLAIAWHETGAGFTGR